MGTVPNTSTTFVPMDAKAITTSDSADQAPYAFRGFMVTTAGNVSVLMAGGDGSTPVVIPACQPGVQYAACISRFRATDTTATGIVGLV